MAAKSYESKYPAFMVVAGGRVFQFRRGRLVVAEKKDQVLLEGSPSFGVAFWERPVEQPADPLERYKVSDTALEMLEEAGVPVEVAARKLGVPEGGRITVNAVRELLLEP